MSEADSERSPSAVEEEVRRRWAERGLPAPDGTVGQGGGPLLRQFLGMFTLGDPPALVAHRGVVADMDARAEALSGGRAVGILRREAGAASAPEAVVAPLLSALAVWTGGADGHPFDDRDRLEGVQRLANRLARMGLLALHDGSVRVCTSCQAPRSPERTIYHEEVGDTFLVRFALEPDADGLVVEALAWVDAPWRLLGATALLVNPDLSYATVECRQGEAVARVLTLRSSIDRLRSWLPGVELQVVGEKPGRAYAGRRYSYPLRHEFPDGASLVPPGGTVQAVAEVGDSGTGVVPLVPGHGGTDELIAGRLGVPGWPLLTLRGTFELTLMHKYAGLDLETANEFVTRDLTEGGNVLARLRVLRGVPYCGVCGRPLVWFPGRCWSLDLGRLPASLAATYAELLPRDRPFAQLELSAWPASETRLTDAHDAVVLLECDRCSRLDAPDGPPKCPCGAPRRPVGRRLVPSLQGALAAWSGEAVAPGDEVHLYVSERRRAPAIVHQLVAMAAAGATGAGVRATIVPTVTDVDLAGLVRELGADAVRSALVRVEGRSGLGGAFVERCRQEGGRLRRLSRLAAAVAGALERDTGGLTPSAGASDRDLLPEDRALLARWGAVELQVRAAYESRRPAEAHRRIARFVEVDLAQYLELARGRLRASPSGGARRTVDRALAGVLASIAVALAPVAPFTAEAIVRTVRPSSRTIFETAPFDVDAAPADEGLAAAWDRWLAVARGVERLRLAYNLAPEVRLPSLALVVSDDALGDQLRADRPMIERLANVARLEVGSPREPWTGRRRQLVPIESEVQRAYPALASQVLYLLRRTPPGRLGGGVGPRGVTVVVQGHPIQVPPSMLSYLETLPDRVVPARFPLGEMFAEMPGGGPPSSGDQLVDLSVDASWLVRRLSRRLRPLSAEARTGLAVRLIATDPLAKELRERTSAIARFLGVGSVAVETSAEPGAGSPAVTGRTRLGARWAVEVTGTPLPAEPRHRPLLSRSRHETRRLPVRQPAQPVGAPSVDFADEQEIGRAEAVRALGEKLDQLLGAPLLGPAKIKLAWEAGYTTADELMGASFDELQTLPGFGRPVAVRLYVKLGREVPPPPPRPRRPPPSTVETPEAATEAVGPPGSSGGGPPPLEPGPGGPSLPSPVSRPEDSPPSPNEEPPTPPGEEGPAAVGYPEGGAETPADEAGTTRPPPAEGRAPGRPIVPTPVVRPAPPPLPPLEPEFLSEADHSVRSAEALQRAPVAPEPPSVVGLEIDLSESFLSALQPFLESTAAGHRGLAIVREFPERTRSLVGPRPVAVYWLSNLSRDRTVRPGDLAALATLVRQGVEANGISSVFLEGFEYLVRIHGIDAVDRFLRDLDRLARDRGARVWLHLTPGLLSPPEMDRLVGGPPSAAEPESPPSPEPPATQGDGEPPAA